MDLKKIFTENKTIAVFGMSTNSQKAANRVPVFFLEKGYTVVPINPGADSINNQKAYAKIEDIPDNIDILNVFRPSDQCLPIVEAAVKRHKAKGDIKLIWLQEGIINEEAKQLAEDNGIEFVQDRCMFKEYFNR